MTEESPNQYRRILQMAAGAGSGMVTKTAIAPLERVKILFQVQGMMKKEPGTANKYPKGIVRTMQIILREEGLRGLYKGNGANVVRVIPNYALKFTFNDTFKDMIRRPNQPRAQMSFNQMMQAGTLAGVFQAVMTYPLEVVRTRLSLAVAFGGKYRGITHCAISSIREEGVTSLYKGLTPTLISAGPYVGLQMTFYEMTQRFMPTKTDGSTGMWSKLVGGAVAGLLAQTITFPGPALWATSAYICDATFQETQYVAACKQMVITGLETVDHAVTGIGGKERVYRNSWDCLKTTVAQEGVVGLFRGLKANAIRCIPGAAIQFAAYDTLKTLFRAQ